MFSPIFERKIIPEDLIRFRKLLGLTTREFAIVFEFSQALLNALEKNRTSGKDILKRLEILLNFHAVALDFLLLNGGDLIHEKWAYAVGKTDMGKNSIERNKNFRLKNSKGKELHPFPFKTPFPSCLQATGCNHSAFTIDRTLVRLLLPLS
jgi:hypothetical protein